MVNKPRFTVTRRKRTAPATCFWIFLFIPAMVYGQPATQSTTQPKGGLLKLATRPTTQPATRPASVREQDKLSDRIQRDPDSVTQELENVEADKEPAGIFDYGPLLAPVHEEYKRFQRGLNEKFGLDLGFAYTMLYQRASGDEPNYREAGGGDFDFFGRWHIIDRDGDRPGSLFFQTETRHRYTSIAPFDLGENIGSLWPTTSGFNDQGFALRQLYYDQHFVRDKLIVRVGKIDLAEIFSVYDFGSDNFGFVNFALSDNPAIPFPLDGLGAAAHWTITDLLYIRGGFSDANADRETAGFDTFFHEGEFFTIAEIGLMPYFEDLGQGYYETTFWYQSAHDNGQKPSGRGVAFVAQQDLPYGLTPFFRYGYAHNGGARVRQLLSGGFGLREPLRRKQDLLGLGFAWGETPPGHMTPGRDGDRPLLPIEPPSFGPFNNGDNGREGRRQSTDRDQSVIELFYRLQLTPDVQLTPSCQVIFEPVDAPDRDCLAVFGVRLRIAF